MKLTKSQLKQIIQEEIENMQNEGFLDKLKGKIGMKTKTQKANERDMQLFSDKVTELQTAVDCLKWSGGRKGKAAAAKAQKWIDDNSMGDFRHTDESNPQIGIIGDITNEANHMFRQTYGMMQKLGVKCADLDVTKFD